MLIDDCLMSKPQVVVLLQGMVVVQVVLIKDIHNMDKHVFLPNIQCALSE